MDVVILGEALVDLVAERSGLPLRAVPTFRRTLGGAPANVAVGLAALGVEVAIMGKVGADEFGLFLKEELEAAGVDTRALALTAEGPTGLAFVSLTETGERDFLFYGSPSADQLLRPEDIDLDLVRECRLFHFRGLSLTTEAGRDASLGAAQAAREAGGVVTFDPNLRLHQWREPQRARAGLREGAVVAQVVKLNAEELEFLFPDESGEEAELSLLGMGSGAVLVTEGEHGCRVRTAELRLDVPGERVEAVDTTGAGDAFMAGLIYGLLQEEASGGDLPSLDRSSWLAVAGLANRAGALATTARGATGAFSELPRLIREEVE